MGGQVTSTDRRNDEVTSAPSKLAEGGPKVWVCLIFFFF